MPTKKTTANNEIFTTEELGNMPSTPNARVAYLSSLAVSKGIDYEIAVREITPLIRKSMRGDNPTASQLAKYSPKKVKYAYGKF